MINRRFLYLVIGLLLLVGCVSQTTPPPEAQPTSTAPSLSLTLSPTPVPTQETVASTATPEPTEASHLTPAEHIIGIRPGPRGAEFFNRLTGETFVPIGANLIQFHPPEGDTTFTVGDYDHAWMEAQLAEMESLGFNTLRVFLDLCSSRCIDAPGGGLRPEFIENLADFLRLAKAHQVYVVLTSNDLPEAGTYNDGMPCCDPFGGYRGSYYLSPGGVAAWGRYLRDVAEALVQAGAPTETVLAYQINNEQFFLSDVPPLSLREGFVTTANGRTYDMASESEQRLMVEDGLIYFADEVRRAILEADPTALVTLGFFPPDEPHPARYDNRLVLTDRFLRESTLDFYDLHPYDWGSLTLAQEAENFGILEGYNDKPLLLGEFGAFTYLYDSPEAGAQAMVQWQVDSCRYGFDGWLYWLWGERDFNNEVWTGSQGGGVINAALSPNNRPDPCDPGDYAAPVNLAADAELRYSAALAEQPAELAVDGLNGTHWGAGADAPQWFQLDLGAPAQIMEIRLLVSQYPAGETHHRIRGLSEGGEWITLTEFEGSTQDGDWLEGVFGFSDMSFQILRIETLRSLSWVSWYEVIVYGEFAEGGG